MKESFRETDRVSAEKIRSFVEQHWPRSASPDQVSTAEVGALLAGLDEAVAELPDGRGGVLADDPAFRRKTLSLKVRFAAIEALERRALAGGEAALAEDSVAAVVAILCTELRLAASGLVIEALGYYALPKPDERAGDNEAPLGGAYARSARQGMLAGLFELPGTLDAERDRLARQLLEAADMGESGTGH